MQHLRLLILGSHPIPYRTPLYRELARRQNIELQVLYGDDYGIRPRYSGWGIQDFVWKTNIIEGYPHVFLSNWSPKPDPSTIIGKLNPGLIPAIYKFKPDAILATGYSGPFHLQGIIGALARHTPVLFLCDSNGAASQPKGVRGWAKPRVLRALYNRFAAFLTIGERNRQHYRTFGVPEQKMFSFPYAVDNEHFSSEAARLRGQRRELREQWRIPHEAICVVYTGRFSSEKNISELINGVARVDGLHLLLVGDGPERETLEVLASEQLPNRHTFAGFLNQDRLGEAYAAADLFALTSYREAWGLACNEAMNFGLPLVLSDKVGCHPDLVTPGKTGWTYTLGNIDALARAFKNTKAMVLSQRAEVAETVRCHIAAFNYQSQADGVTEALCWVLDGNKG
jgi:glycosyltransferase involved in cell wall biosynthesis